MLRPESWQPRNPSSFSIPNKQKRFWDCSLRVPLVHHQQHVRTGGRNTEDHAHLPHQTPNRTPLSLRGGSRQGGALPLNWISPAVCKPCPQRQAPRRTRVCFTKLTQKQAENEKKKKPSGRKGPVAPHAQHRFWQRRGSGSTEGFTSASRRAGGARNISPCRGEAA